MVGYLWLFVLVIWILTMKYRFDTQLPNSAFKFLAKIHIFSTIWTALVIFLCLSFVLDLVITCVYKDRTEEHKKLNREIIPFELVVSLILSMLLTETTEQFQFVATIVSFALLFQALFPKHFVEDIVKFNTDIHKKWSQYKNKKQ